MKVFADIKAEDSVSSQPDSKQRQESFPFMERFMAKYDELSSSQKASLWRNMTKNPLVAIVNFVGGEEAALALVNLTPSQFSAALVDQLIAQFPELALFQAQLSKVQQVIEEIVDIPITTMTDVAAETLFNQDGSPKDLSLLLTDSSVEEK